MTEAHVRIDEGVKRGPKMRLGRPTKRSHLADIGTWVIPKDLNPDAVIQQSLSEATTSQIARQYGVSRKAMTKWLREQRPKEWKQAQIVRALALKEDSEEGMLSARDALSLARNRELLKAAQFDLTSLDPDYQPRQEIALTVDHHVTVSQGLETEISQLFEKIRAVVQQPNEIIDLQPDAEQQISSDPESLLKDQLDQ